MARAWSTGPEKRFNLGVEFREGGEWGGGEGEV